MTTVLRYLIRQTSVGPDRVISSFKVDSYEYFSDVGGLVVVIEPDEGQETTNLITINQYLSNLQTLLDSKCTLYCHFYHKNNGSGSEFRFHGLLNIKETIALYERSPIEGGVGLVISEKSSEMTFYSTINHILESNMRITMQKIPLKKHGPGPKLFQNHGNSETR